MILIKIFLQTNLLSYYLVSPDVRNSDLEAGFPVQLFYFNQTLRYPEIAVALESTFLCILGVFDGNFLKMPNLSARHSIIPEPWKVK